MSKHWWKYSELHENYRMSAYFITQSSKLDQLLCKMQLYVHSDGFIEVKIVLGSNKG